MPSLVRIQHPPPSVRRAQRRMPITRSERVVRGPAQPRISPRSAALHRVEAVQAGEGRAGSAVPVGSSMPVGTSVSVFAGVAQLVERQPSKLNVASSNLVSRSPSIVRGRPNPRTFVFLVRGRPNPRTSGSERGRPDPRSFSVPFGGLDGSPKGSVLRGSANPQSAHLAQLVEHVLGKDEVISSILMVGSNRTSCAGGGVVRCVLSAPAAVGLAC
jgi:hypothetical protein